MARRSGIPQPEHQPAGQQGRRGPGGEHAQATPRADGQAAQAGGGLDGQPAVVGAICSTWRSQCWFSSGAMIGAR